VALVRCRICGGTHSYQTYVGNNSFEWQEKKRQAFAYWGYQCWLCGCRDGSFEVHHLHYRTMCHELMTDLRVVCPRCHALADYWRVDRLVMPKRNHEQLDLPLKSA
jgi:hypothetical protein